MKRNTNLIVLLIIIIIGLVVYITVNNSKKGELEAPAVSDTETTTTVVPESTSSTSATPAKKITTSSTTTKPKTTTSSTPNTQSINKTLLENNPYVKYGFYIETPKGYRMTPQGDTTTPAISMGYPGGVVSYIKDAAAYEQSTITPKYKYQGTTKVGGDTFKVYSYGTMTYYWITKGNVGYEFVTTKKDSLSTFEFLD